MNGIMLHTRGNKIVNRGDVYSYDIPYATTTYTPISNKEIIETTLEELDKNNFYVKNEFHKTDSSHKKFVGGFVINSDDIDMDLMFGYKNSYDKSIAAAVCNGAQVIVCSNGLLRGEEVMVRKHTGNAKEIVLTSISEGIKRLYDNYTLLKKEMDTLKQIEISKKTCAELVGRMYLEEEMITSHQLSVIKGELTKESYNYGIENTAYNLYQAVSHSLKKSSPMTYFKDHANLHNFFLQEQSLYTNNVFAV